MSIELRAAITAISKISCVYTPALLMCSWHFLTTACDVFTLTASLGDKLIKEIHTLLERPLKIQCFHFSKQLLPFGGSFVMGML